MTGPPATRVSPQPAARSVVETSTQRSSSIVAAPESTAAPTRAVAAANAAVRSAVDATNATTAPAALSGAGRFDDRLARQR